MTMQPTSDFAPPDQAFAITRSQVRDIAPDVLDKDGRFQILPAEFWAETTVAERGLFGVQHGIYSFPTTEMVDYLKLVIRGKKAIEIGAGNGVLAEALDITATDNMQQLMPEYRSYYESIQQPIVPYGDNVVKIDAHEAVRKYKPQVVIGCWVTHKYDPKRHAAGGNEIGIKEEYIIDRTETYVHFGNEHVHRGKAIWSRKHAVENFDWIYSRAMNGTPDFVGFWE